MRLVTYQYDGIERVGALTPDGAAILPLPYPDMNTLIESASFADLLSAASAAESSGASVPAAEAVLCAPIPRPRQDIICLGMNYRDHLTEAANYDSAFAKERPVTVYFSKRVSQAVAPEGFIERHPNLTKRLDYENELAVILGRAARDVKAADTADYIFGYTIVNDVSAREVQTSHKQFYFGKSLDGFTPMGPCITTADEIAFPPALTLTTLVNGEPRQSSNTSLLLNSIAEIIEELSSGMTLLPGTIIATGTPAGVGMGFDPPKFLASGDVVACTIEGIGTLRNTVR